MTSEMFLGYWFHKKTDVPGFPLTCSGVSRYHGTLGLAFVPTTIGISSSILVEHVVDILAGSCWNFVFSQLFY